MAEDNNSNLNIEELVPDAEDGLQWAAKAMPVLVVAAFSSWYKVNHLFYIKIEIKKCHLYT